jgi:hypothetical protein
MRHNIMKLPWYPVSQGSVCVCVFTSGGSTGDAGQCAGYMQDDAKGRLLLYLEKMALCKQRVTPRGV